MLQIAEGLQQLQEDFDAAGISPENPGFYEDFQFIRREHKDPTYINNYARYIQWQPYSDAYLDKAEQTIHIVAAELQLAMQLDPNQPSYDESPLVFSRILEREGIWNFVVHGAMSVAFPVGSGFEPHSFPAVNAEKATRKVFGYKWVVAPPFKVIDLSIQTQDFPHPVGHLLPRIILEKTVETTELDPAEVMSQAAIEETKAAGMSLLEGLDRLAPGYLGRFATDFPPCTFIHDETQFRFIPLKIVTTEDSIEQFKGFTSKGRNAMEIYQQEIKPRLLKE